MFFRTVRDQFLVEIAAGPDGAGSAVDTLAELNSLFTAWVEQVYHQRVHTETGMTPLARFLAAGPPVPTPAGLLTEAFRWGEWRTVTSTATVSLHGNLYQVDAALAGTRVELTFDPFDLTDIDVRHRGRPAGDPDRHRLPAAGKGNGGSWLERSIRWWRPALRSPLRHTSRRARRRRRRQPRRRGPGAETPRCRVPPRTPGRHSWRRGSDQTLGTGSAEPRTSRCRRSA